MSSFKNQKEIPSRVIGIQFSILSPEEIRKMSVAEITSRDTYIGNKPVLGGLFDPRMGVLEPGLICPTDGLDYIKTPGYFGHIELAKPVYYIQYLTTIIKILRCVCIKCSKLRISKETYSYLLNERSEKRWNAVFAKASKVRRCGDESDDGCGCTQPIKIKKEGLATIMSEWESIDGIDKAEGEKPVIKLTAEMVLKILSRISDEDVNFMGFSSVWSRPEWMVCQVLAVAPPAVRPSVKHDSQQRSEDDISHILVNIIKANMTLREKIQQNANESIINDWHTVLQYYVATQVDNNLPGVASVAQRSGRPLKSVRERLVGKAGRLRGNLMGKRVDFSARSVITPDPNLKIWELGVPKKIAMNLTKPVTINKYNIEMARELIKNGPDKYPGAKILEKKNGDNISLRYIDRESLYIEVGDIVHRHILDGDYVLFNRQPTLHRPSMMAHQVRVMKRGYTFRMNVACTKPYNADFDGDEMNMHMPQDVEAEMELKELAQVPYQLISPANNKSIVGIFQDSLLGCYLFSKAESEFNKRDAMNLLSILTNINTMNLPLNDSSREMVKYTDILSQILPQISLKYKTKQFDSNEQFNTSNHVLEITNGNFIRGQLDKGVMGDTSKGLIHRICNDYGNFAASEFINNIQSIITAFMTSHAYSVGISDLIASDDINKKIISTITESKMEVEKIIDETHLGIFNNDTGNSNKVEFETKVNNILNKAMSSAQKVAHSNLSSSNRFLEIVNAGSKGSVINISQMISCLGQQIIESNRIPNGFDNRTLPHYTKFNDEAGARGFIENSFISGLIPQELFFHAMSGRIGLIDTAVKTSRTGYIQRRLIKSMEDLIVKYDLTVRNNKNKIIQFQYGYDNFDTVMVESQSLKLVEMNYNDIYSHYQFLQNRITSKAYSAIFTEEIISKIRKQKTEWNTRCSDIVDYLIKQRNEIIKYVFEFKNNSKINMPVAFAHIIESIKNQMILNHNSIVDITPLDALKLIDAAYEQLDAIYYCKPTELFKTMFYYYLSPKSILINKRFNKKSLIYLLETIVSSYKRAIIQPGECTGMIAAQSIGEPTTQMTLNTFHHAGVGSKTNVTRGVMRIEELLSLSENPKSKSLTIYTNPENETNEEYCQSLRNKLEYTNLRKITKSIQVYYDPSDRKTEIEEDQELIDRYNIFKSMIAECRDATSQSGEEETKGTVGLETDEDSNKEEFNNSSKWLIRLELNPELMYDKQITTEDVHFVLKSIYKDDISCIYSDYNEDKIIFRIRFDSLLKKNKNSATPLDQTDEIYLLKNFQNKLLDSTVIRGVKNINSVLLRKVTDNVSEVDSEYVQRDIWVLDTDGINLQEVLGLDYVDNKRTTSNHIGEVYVTLGIEAARQCLLNEIKEVMEYDGTYINYHHLSLLCDRMTCSHKMISAFRHGINNDDIGPIAKASFEETPEMFMRAAKHGELDNLCGVSSNVMCGQEGYYGTNAFQVIADFNQMNNIQSQNIEDESDDFIENQFKDLSPENDSCSQAQLIINNNIDDIKPKDYGDNDDYDIDL